MASESGEEVAAVALPRELSEWLEAEAETAGVDRDALAVELLAAYRAAALEGEDGEGLLGRTDARLDEKIDERIDEATAALEDGLNQLEREHERARRTRSEAAAEQDERLTALEKRLETVAWIVHDFQQRASSDDDVDRLKEAGARADVERAVCEGCGEGVALALLTGPRCPHCEATLTDVKPASGWFDKPTLTVTSQPSGDET